MKKAKILLSLLLVFVYAFLAMGSSETSESGQSSGNQGNGEAEVTEQASDTSIGDYSIVIDSCRLATDWEGKPVVIVKYIFTNVADDNAASFYSTFDETVYQNGVGLNETLMVDDNAGYSMDNQTKEIKKGASLDVEVAYDLNDTTTDIEVEVEELFSFDDTTITKTFSIAQ